MNENDFFDLLAIWFPCIYDIKHVVRSVKTLRGGLQEMAESLGVSCRKQPSNFLPWHSSPRYLAFPVACPDELAASSR